VGIPLFFVVRQPGRDPAGKGNDNFYIVVRRIYIVRIVRRKINILHPKYTLIDDPSGLRGGRRDGRGDEKPMKDREMLPAIMVVDDDDDKRQAITTLVEKSGYTPCPATSGEEALDLYPREKPALVLLDCKMAGMDGLQVLERLKQIDPSCKVVMMSSYDDANTIVKAMKLGAENYLVQPVPVPELQILIDKLVEGPLAVAREERAELEGVVGNSQAMQMVFRMVRRVAGTKATLLIRGESGTGKEVIARAIHLLSPSSNRSFVTVDCTNIPSNLMESELFGHERGAFTDARTRKLGLLETADRGTLFLDEIGLMPLDLQAKLLNILETQRFRRVGGNEEIHVSVRILAATNEDLEEAVKEGRFREDLYYRLNVVPIDLPPLREREKDVLLIAENYLQWYTSLHATGPRQLAKDAQDLLQVYPWPGNVRELKNVIERAVLMTDSRIIPASALTIDRRSRKETETAVPVRVDAEGKVAVSFPPDGLSLDYVEQQIIEAALAQSGRNVTRAAAPLHLSRDTLRYRIAKFKTEEK